MATLDLLKAEYMANAHERGLQLRSGLAELQRTYPQIGDIRGLGLMTAADIVSPTDGKTLDPTARDEIVEQAFYKGLLLLGCGEAAIRFCPPLCISADQIDTALDILSTLLSTREPKLVAV